MSTFTENYAAAALPALFDVYGQAVTYTPAGGDGVALTAILSPDEIEELPTLDGRELRRTRHATISRDPDGDAGGVASPSHRDTVTADGRTYAVEAVAEMTDAWARLRLTHSAALEVTRPAYRRSQ